MLKTSKEFDFVYKNSYKFRSEVLDICVLRANMAGQFYEKFRRLPCNFVGFSVSKKVGNAVERNLIKRRLRAICRDFFGTGNSSLGLHSADFANLGHCTDFSLALRPKFAKNHESQTENPSVVDSANLINSQNLNKNNPCEAPENSPASWCKKSESKGAEVPPADFLLEAEKRGSPPKSEKAAAFWRVGGAGRGVQPFLRKESSENCGEGGAESRLDYVDSAIISQNVLPRRFCESARNDNIAQNLICIFIAKSQILQTPFIALKNNIFATLKRQLNFRQGLYKKPRTISPHSTQSRISQNHAKGAL